MGSPRRAGFPGRAPRYRRTVVADAAAVSPFVAPALLRRGRAPRRALPGVACRARRRPAAAAAAGGSLRGSWHRRFAVGHRPSPRTPSGRRSVAPSLRPRRTPNPETLVMSRTFNRHAASKRSPGRRTLSRHAASKRPPGRRTLSRHAAFPANAGAATCKRRGRTAAPRPASRREVPAPRSQRTAAAARERLDPWRPRSLNSTSDVTCRGVSF